MGVGISFDDFEYPCIKKQKTKRQFTNFKVLRSSQIGKNLLVEIQYFEFSNFDGKKIMLYENMDIKKLLLEKEINPHFLDDKIRSPIARFRATEFYWIFAENFLKYMESYK